MSVPPGGTRRCQPPPHRPGVPAKSRFGRLASAGAGRRIRAHASAPAVWTADPEVLNESFKSWEVLNDPFKTFDRVREGPSGKPGTRNRPATRKWMAGRLREKSDFVDLVGDHPRRDEQRPGAFRDRRAESVRPEITGHEPERGVVGQPGGAKSQQAAAGGTTEEIPALHRASECARSGKSRRCSFRASPAPWSDGGRPCDSGMADAIPDAGPEWDQRANAVRNRSRKESIFQTGACAAGCRPSVQPQPEIRSSTFGSFATIVIGSSRTAP